MSTPKRGRPKSDKGHRALKTTLRFHPDELAIIKAAAKKEKTMTATFIRDAALWFASRSPATG